MSTRDGTAHQDAAPPALSAWQPWAALAVIAFVLNFGWEMLQAPLYESMAGLSWEKATWLCSQASAGDAVITLAAYGSVAVLAGSRAWIARPRATHVTGYLAGGLVLTVVLELLNVYALGRWAYGSGMPRVLGVGLAPLTQWLVVPLASLWVTRSYLRHMTMYPSTDIGDMP